MTHNNHNPALQQIPPQSQISPEIQAYNIEAQNLTSLQQTWRAMETPLEEGLTKYRFLQERRAALYMTGAFKMLNMECPSVTKSKFTLKRQLSMLHAIQDLVFRLDAERLTEELSSDASAQEQMLVKYLQRKLPQLGRMLKETAGIMGVQPEMQNTPMQLQKMSLPEKWETHDEQDILVWRQQMMTTLHQKFLSWNVPSNASDERADTHTAGWRKSLQRLERWEEGRRQWSESATGKVRKYLSEPQLSLEQQRVLARMAEVFLFRLASCTQGLAHEDRQERLDETKQQVIKSAHTLLALLNQIDGSIYNLAALAKSLPPDMRDVELRNLATWQTEVFEQQQDLLSLKYQLAQDVNQQKSNSSIHVDQNQHQQERTQLLQLQSQRKIQAPLSRNNALDNDGTPTTTPTQQDAPVSLTQTQSQQQPTAQTSAPAALASVRENVQRSLDDVQAQLKDEQDEALVEMQKLYESIPERLSEQWAAAERNSAEANFGVSAKRVMIAVKNKMESETVTRLATKQDIQAHLNQMKPLWKDLQPEEQTTIENETRNQLEKFQLAHNAALKNEIETPLRDLADKRIAREVNDRAATLLVDRKLQEISNRSHGNVPNDGARGQRVEQYLNELRPLWKDLSDDRRKELEDRTTERLQKIVGVKGKNSTVTQTYTASPNVPSTPSSSNAGAWMPTSNTPLVNSLVTPSSAADKRVKQGGRKVGSLMSTASNVEASTKRQIRVHLADAVTSVFVGIYKGQISGGIQATLSPARLQQLHVETLNDVESKAETQLAKYLSRQLNESERGWIRIAACQPADQKTYDEVIENLVQEALNLVIRSAERALAPQLESKVNEKLSTHTGPLALTVWDIDQAAISATMELQSQIAEQVHGQMANAQTLMDGVSKKLTMLITDTLANGVLRHWDVAQQANLAIQPNSSTSLSSVASASSTVAEDVKTAVQLWRGSYVEPRPLYPNDDFEKGVPLLRKAKDCNLVGVVAGGTNEVVMLSDKKVEERGATIFNFETVAKRNLEKLFRGETKLTGMNMRAKQPAQRQIGSQTNNKKRDRDSADASDDQSNTKRFRR